MNDLEDSKTQNIQHKSMETKRGTMNAAKNHPSSPQNKHRGLKFDEATGTCISYKEIFLMIAVSGSALYRRRRNVLSAKYWHTQNV